MFEHYILGTTNQEPVYPAEVADSWAWSTYSYTYHEDAYKNYIDTTNNYRWKSKQTKAAYLAKVVFGWDGKLVEFLMLEKKAHPAEKVVLYNKHDIVAKPPESKASIKLKSLLSSAALEGWNTYTVTSSIQDSIQATGDFFDHPTLPESEQAEGTTEGCDLSSAESD